MPAFQKIGGLLINSITTDTATLHDVVIAINRAVIDNVRLFYLESYFAFVYNINIIMYF